MAIHPPPKTTTLTQRYRRLPSPRFLPRLFHRAQRLQVARHSPQPRLPLQISPNSPRRPRLSPARADQKCSRKRKMTRSYSSQSLPLLPALRTPESPPQKLPLPPTLAIPAQIIAFHEAAPCETCVRIPALKQRRSAQQDTCSWPARSQRSLFLR